MNELALFAGAGGGILGGHLLGWRTVCAVECECYPSSILVQRQNEGFLKPFPIWDDVRTFDGKEWNGFVDVVSGGFPCQDISVAGNGAGLDGERSGLWREMARIVREVRPQFVFVENSPALTFRGLDRVLGDLAEMGFDAEWGVLSAADVGAPHRRERIWILAYSTSIRQQRQGLHGRPVHTKAHSHRKANFSLYSGEGKTRSWLIEPDVGRVADGVAARMDRLKAIGNGQVPLVAATAFQLLKERMGC
jgi:DNA (cytosine-5)-methyltransferase 1